MTTGMFLVFAGSIMLGWNFGNKDYGNAFAGLMIGCSGFLIP